MFERFTPRARNAVAAASEEAIALGHNYIGSEHLLLALLRDPESVAYRALEQVGASAETIRAEVTSRVPRGDQPSYGHRPFTPRAKKALESSLRESLSLGYDYIGTEHLLLGLVKGDGVAADVLATVTTPGKLRDAIGDLVPTTLRRERPRRSRRLRDVLRNVNSEETDDDLVADSPAAAAIIATAKAAAGNGPLGSHHLLAATLQDDNSAAARALKELGIDLETLRERLKTADPAGTSDETPEDAGRRHLTLKLDGDHAILAIDDPTLLSKLRAVIQAHNLNADESIHGEAHTAFRTLWLAIRDVLDDMTEPPEAA
ncbi:MAG TPA: Clp protease N-terminal domain-containing protein [Mycobacteriales bacterium]|nr:Clp protease N-terminal domain-containing protein [Mycobacteriales bacterium]